jgi:hypothetical protein
VGFYFNEENNVSLKQVYGGVFMYNRLKSLNNRLFLTLMMLIMVVLSSCGEKQNKLEIKHEFDSLFEEYTISDNFVNNGESHTLTSYSTNKNNYGKESYRVNINYNDEMISDEIISIIPIQCFENEGLFYFFGVEFGFIVETYKTDDEIFQSKCSVI